MSENPGRPVLLHDGTCGLCNWAVRRLLATDQAGRLHYAPLRGEAAQAYLRAHGLPTGDFDSLVFVRDWAHPGDHAPLLRTDGALAAAAEVGGVWRLVSWLRVLPAWLRDPGYKLVARFRYALFGEYRPRPLPDPTWAERFLCRPDGACGWETKKPDGRPAFENDVGSAAHSRP